MTNEREERERVKEEEKTRKEWSDGLAKWRKMIKGTLRGNEQR